jgi:hypothetical protein
MQHITPAGYSSYQLLLMNSGLTDEEIKAYIKKLYTGFAKHPQTQEELLGWQNYLTEDEVAALRKGMQ